MKKIPVRHISTTKEPDFSENFSIRDIRSLLAGKDMVQELHRHDFFYILALKKGSGSHEIDFTPYKICDNTVFFMRPGQVHQLLLKTGSTGYLIQFSAEFYYPHDKVLNQLLRKASHINHYQLSAGKLRKLLSILAYIFQEYTDREKEFQEVIKANMDIFFVELLRQQSSSSSNSTNLYMQQQLDKFLELVEKNIFKNKQVSQYADMLSLSTYQLNAIAKSTLGKTCSEIINEYIVLEAKRYLLATSNQINQIADDLGYEDVSYFIRFFKKHTGYSPAAFRNNIK